MGKYEYGQREKLSLYQAEQKLNKVSSLNCVEEFNPRKSEFQEIKRMNKFYVNNLVKVQQVLALRL